MKPMVYSGIYPTISSKFEDLREAYETVSVNAERDYNGGVTK